ncbi:MAG: hypothetical protein D6784_09585 [Chloroflexi bacterium]|nr:MAG: hypothetical protein D6784_09585 [Chloroflexota bacterium]
MGIGIGDFDLAKRKELLINLALAVGGLVFLLVVLEIGFRLVEGLEARAQSQGEPWAVYDPDLKYRPRPNHDDFNADGLRDDPIAPVKTKFRLLMLGDSVAFYGDSISDTFPGRLETALNQDEALTPTEVINAGVRGYTNLQELIFLKKYGLQFQPDLVGVALVLNDMHPYLHEFKVENGKIVGQEYVFAQEAVQSVDSPLYRLARKSRLLVWLRRQLSIFDDMINVYAQEGYTFDYRPDFNTAWKEKPWQDVERQMAEMVQLGQENGFRVFVVIFPFGEQYREDYLARDRDYVLFPQTRMQAICQSLDMPCLDLYPILTRDDLIADDIHLTQAGREKTAQAIAGFLKENNLIPSR